MPSATLPNQRLAIEELLKGFVLRRYDNLIQLRPEMKKRRQP